MEKITPMVTRNPEVEETAHGERRLSHSIQRLSKKNAGENSRRSTSCAFSKKLSLYPHWTNGRFASP